MSDYFRSLPNYTIINNVFTVIVMNEKVPFRL